MRTLLFALLCSPLLLAQAIVPLNPVRIEFLAPPRPFKAQASSLFSLSASGPNWCALLRNNDGSVLAAVGDPSTVRYQLLPFTTTAVRATASRGIIITTESWSKKTSFWVNTQPPSTKLTPFPSMASWIDRKPPEPKIPQFYKEFHTQSGSILVTGTTERVYHFNPSGEQVSVTTLDLDSAFRLLGSAAKRHPEDSGQSRFSWAAWSQNQELYVGLINLPKTGPTRVAKFSTTDGKLLAIYALTSPESQLLFPLAAVGDQLILADTRRNRLLFYNTAP